MRSGLLPFLTLANLLFFIVSLPMVFSWLETPSDQFYVGVHGTPIDYYQYLGVIKEGMNGSWLTTDLYTTETTPKSLVFVYFIIAGKIGGFFGLSAVITYHLARIISVEFMFIALFLVCQEVVGKKYAFWAATLGLFSTAPPLKYIPSLQAYLGDYNWWDVLDPLHRADYLPHHAFAIALMLSSLLYTLKFIKEKRFYQFILAFITAMGAGVIYPITGFVLAIVPALTASWYLTRELIVKKSFNLQAVFPLLLISAGSGIVLLIMELEISKGFPWSGWRAGFGNSLWNRVGHFERNFILALGFTFLLALPSIIRSFRPKSSMQEILISLWAVIPIVFVLFSTRLGLEKIRMAYLGQFAAYGILATLSLQWFSHHIHSKVGQTTLFSLVGMLLVVNVVLVSGYYFSQRMLLQVYRGGGNVQLPMSLLPAYNFIDHNVPVYSNVLGDFIIGNTLPAFATVKTYFGHWTQTLDYWRKEAEEKAIFARQLEPSGVAAILQKEKIQYIVARTPIQIDAMEYYRKQLPLELVYNDKDIRIYQVTF